MRSTTLPLTTWTSTCEDEMLRKLAISALNAPTNAASMPSIGRSTWKNTAAAVSAIGDSERGALENGGSVKAKGGAVDNTSGCEFFGGLEEIDTNWPKGAAVGSSWPGNTGGRMIGPSTDSWLPIEIFVWSPIVGDGVYAVRTAAAVSGSILASAAAAAVGFIRSSAACATAGST